ncbi:hypothetical protein ACSYDW_01220 [Paeniglutamicibacter sp. R2-26]|uniref:hypothetical protein n=1 Tax=Paeniglutamicibacter sp. R2-26 TaxID=3144417 RepID=UPI003EE7C626
MSAKQGEIPKPPAPDLVRIDFTTTREHAEVVVTSAVDALEGMAANFANIQSVMIGRGQAGPAVYTNQQLGKILEALVAAQQLLDKITTQGEQQ